MDSGTCDLLQPRLKSFILDDLGGRSVGGVSGDKFIWKSAFGVGGEYTFSLRNRLHESVKNVYCLVIFHDVLGEPIDVDVVHFERLIPAGLAKRVTSEVNSRSVQELSTDFGLRYLQTRAKFRILTLR